MTDRRLSLALVLVAAAAATLGVYYAIHKPFGAAQARVFAQSGATLLVAGWLTWLAGGLGRKVVRGHAAASAPGERVLLDIALGWGGMALLLLALGMARLYHSLIAWPLALIASLWLRRDAKAWFTDVAAALAALRPRGRMERLAAGLVTLLLGLGLLRALAPPVMWDALVYHLTLPARYIQARGVWLPLSDFSLFTGMPQVSEMLYTAAMLLHGPLADGGLIEAQTLGWAFGAALVLGLASLAQRLDLPGIWAVSVLFASFTIALSLAWGYAELLPMLFASAMLAALFRWRDEPQRRWLLLAGMLGGLAWGGKYTGIIVPAAGAVAAIVIAAERPSGLGWGVALQTGAIYLLAAAGVFAPWLIKNWMLSGSPVYPLLWPAADMDALRQWFFSRPDLAQTGLGGVLIFFRAIFLGVQGGNAYDATLTPLLVILPGLLGVGWFFLPVEDRRRLRPVVAFTVSAYLGWVTLTYLSPLAVQPRLFFAALPALALLAAAGLQAARSLDTGSLRLSWVVKVITLIALVLGVVESLTFFINQNPLAYLVGSQSASDYRLARLGWFEAAFREMDALPTDARVIQLWEPRSLGCPTHITCVPDVAIDRWWHARRTAGSAAAILAQWQASGATHVLIYETGAEFVAADPASPLEPADWTELEVVRRRLITVSAVGPAYTLYAIP